MDFKAAVFYGILCLAALSLCLEVGCGSNPPPAAPAHSPGYFGKFGQGPGEAHQALLKQHLAKSKGKARPTPRAK
jgi:hypothetical protein